MNPAPIVALAAVLFFSMLFVELAELIVWRIFNPLGYLEALAALEEYGSRIIELRRRPGRRAERKAALLDARLHNYRRFLVKLSFTRSLLYVMAYVGASGVIYHFFPLLLPAPAPLPLLTIRSELGPLYTPSQLTLAALMFFTFRMSMPPLIAGRRG